jgi:hypothetical protein
MARGKSGPKDVDEASRGTNTANTSGGGPGRSFPQRAVAGPAGSGQPSAMKKALTKKPMRAGTTGYAGNLKPNPRA